MVKLGCDGRVFNPGRGNYIAATDDFHHGHYVWGVVDLAAIAADEFGGGEAEAAARVAKNLVEDAGKAEAKQAAKAVGENAAKADVEKAAKEAEKAKNSCPAAGKPANPRPGGSLPKTSTPNSSQVEDRGNGDGTIRDYGPDGNRQTDYDFGHNHPPDYPGDPHAHDWPPNGGGPRGPGRPLKPGESCSK